ncbi:hypothetical protein FTO70_04640 [Methanosarcina sp. KYL-1]|nr:hypothetical protein [Methanosarcina sp. KYL-1]
MPFPDYVTSQKYCEILYQYTSRHIAVTAEEQGSIPDPMKPFSRAFVEVLEAFCQLSMRTNLLSQEGAEALALIRDLERCTLKANEGIEGAGGNVCELVDLDRGLNELTEAAQAKADILAALQRERVELMEKASEKAQLLNGELLTLFSVGVLAPAGGEGNIKKLCKALKSQERRKPGKPGFRVKPVGVKLRLPSWKK